MGNIFAFSRIVDFMIRLYARNDPAQTTSLLTSQLPDGVGLLFKLNYLQQKEQHMSVFTNNELDYLREQRLGRLATVDSAGDPHVVPVGFRYNPETDSIDIGGHDIAQSKKWRDAGQHPRLAFVVDDVLPPWQPRSIEILADAELLESGGDEFGHGFDPQIIRLHSVQIIAWGVDKERQSRKVKNVEKNELQNHVIV
jgi:pyridoxamine 5'-phosphate oxidase family protein